MIERVFVFSNKACLLQRHYTDRKSPVEEQLLSFFLPYIFKNPNTPEEGSYNFPSSKFDLYFRSKDDLRVVVTQARDESEYVDPNQIFEALDFIHMKFAQKHDFFGGEDSQLAELLGREIDLTLGLDHRVQKSKFPDTLGPARPEVKHLLNTVEELRGDEIHSTLDDIENWIQATPWAGKKMQSTLIKLSWKLRCLSSLDEWLTAT